MFGIPLATPTSIPDIDQSVVSLARDHLSSGSISGVVSVSGEYRDPSGKIIKRFELYIEYTDYFHVTMRRSTKHQCSIVTIMPAVHEVLCLTLQAWLEKLITGEAGLQNYNAESFRTNSKV